MPGKTNLIDLIDDPHYYIMEHPQSSNRVYLICNNCGYIPCTALDYNTKFLDAHCKCGSPVQSVKLTPEHIIEIKHEKEQYKFMSYDKE